MRVPHWIKQILIFVPFFFSLKELNLESIIKMIGGFFAFSFLASAIYIINDIRDAEKDALHEIKKRRPIASGAISKKSALRFALLLVTIAFILGCFFSQSIYAWICLDIYFVLNFLYTIYLKEIPLIDVFCLASFYIIRITYGSLLSNIEISFWLYMTILFFSLFLAFGKRRNELNYIKTADVFKNSSGGGYRRVLNYYNVSFLDKNMYMCLGMGLMFYALWCNADDTIARLETHLQSLTVPLIAFIFMRYSLDIETGGHADPIEVVYNDKTIVAIGFIYVFMMACILYFR